MPTRARTQRRRRPRESDCCIDYSGERLAREQAELFDPKTAEERWRKGVPINEIESKGGRPPKRTDS